MREYLGTIVRDGRRLTPPSPVRIEGDEGEPPRRGEILIDLTLGPALSMRSEGLGLDLGDGPPLAVRVVDSYVGSFDRSQRIRFDCG